MKLLEGKHMVSTITRFMKNNKDKLRFIEGHANISGLTSIDNVVRLSDKCVEFSKLMNDFETNPFEPATLDNVYEVDHDMCATCQMFLSCVDNTFDARDLLDAEALESVFDNIIRCNVILKHPEECDSLMFLTNAVIEVFAQIAPVLESMDTMQEFFLPEDFVSILYKSVKIKPLDPNDCPSVTFTRLDKQKYFTMEEEQYLREAEIRRQEEQQKAKEAAELGKKYQQFMIMLSKVSFEGDIEKAKRYLSCLTREEILDGYKTLDGIVFDSEQFNGQLRARFETIEDMEFQLKSDGTAEGIRNASKLMSRISGNIITIKSLDTSVNYSDPDNTIDPKMGEWVIMLVSHHESC